MTATSSIFTSPTYSIHREGVDAIDADISVFTKRHGCNATMYKYAHVQVIPYDIAEPAVEVMWWSDQADSFIQEHTALAKASVSAGTPYEFTIEPQGRIFFVKVTAIVTGSVDIMVSGFEPIQLS